MRVVIGIPARFSSSRFPGKPLAMLAGRPMIEHVVLRALAAGVGPVIVATDDERIASAVEEMDVDVRMTDAGHASGSERLAEAVCDIDCDVVVNLQGDEPLIDPGAIRAVLEPMRQDEGLPMATLACPIVDQKHFHSPHVVKVVCNGRSRAMYFSRAAIPYPRQPAIQPLQHVGLYAYRKDFLLSYPKLSPCPAEQAEQLEQLRVLHHGFEIAVSVGDFASHGVDTPDDLARAEALLKAF
ncbi:MAG: 3-deoxy-manno-octulosonate cytidylyltransferase [Mariprofundaceae bacterium]